MPASRRSRMAWQIQAEREIPVPERSIEASSSDTRLGGTRRGIWTFFSFSFFAGASPLPAVSCEAPSMKAIVSFEMAGRAAMVGFLAVICYTVSVLL